MQDSIFINYRRQTDAGTAGRIYDSLNRALPGVSIFMDVDKLAPGEDFEEGLQRSLSQCQVLLAVIGPQWTTMVDASGQPRLSKDDDFVRKEVATALAKGVRVIPVLVGGAKLPQAAELPADLKLLVKRQTVEIRHERFNDDVQALAKAIETSTPATRSLTRHFRDRRVQIIAACGVVAIAAGVGLRFLGADETEPTNASAVATRNGPAWTTWLDQAGYQREFNANVNRQWYPRMIEAKLQDGVVKYRAFYEPFPSSTFGFHARHSINDEEFAQFDAKLIAEGFKRSFHQRITVGERGFNQATWTRP